MITKKGDKIWSKFNMSRREFLRHFGIAASAITFSPFFISRFATVSAQTHTVKAFLVKNGDCFQNTAKIWERLGGASNHISSDDVVVIKGNAQWHNQGYTHTGCIKGVIDGILDIPGFSGEILICDNIQGYGTPTYTGFDAGTWARTHNWPDHNWNSLAAEYRANGKPVATKQWFNSTTDITGPADGEGWIREFFPFHGRNTYLSYPVFESPLSSGRMIDIKNGVWENGSYTGRNVKTIFMPTLNNHGSGFEDYAGITSAIKGFFGSTELHGNESGTFRGYYNMHSSTYSVYSGNDPYYAGELTAKWITDFNQPILYITAAMWSGNHSRTEGAVETKTVLACSNPATLDYVACRDVISPYASYLDPDQDNNTRKQILGCINGGIGTINPTEFEIIAYDFDNPSVNRLDIDRKIRDLKQGSATEQEVKDMIQEYMETP